MSRPRRTRKACRYSAALECPPQSATTAGMSFADACRGCGQSLLETSCMASVSPSRHRLTPRASGRLEERKTGLSPRARCRS
ncbi:hypothetical protein ACFFX0_29050 [Citricoccus parietis]|uniref:Uncharacterized protein n=1 Tax=Citricoccus parietis TaxID=592307 RepID=A0ABV5G7S6_9MICC